MKKDKELQYYCLKSNDTCVVSILWQHQEFITM